MNGPPPAEPLVASVRRAKPANRASPAQLAALAPPTPPRLQAPVAKVGQAKLCP